ncbi:La protein 1 [Fagus crenata]
MVTRIFMVGTMLSFAWFCHIYLYVLFFLFPVKFIDFKIGEDSGYFRFEDPEAAQKARAAALLAEQGGLLVKNYIANLEPVAGEAEKEYWSLLRGNQDRYRGNRGERGGKFNRGGKHGRSREYDGRPNKAQKRSVSRTNPELVKGPWSKEEDEIIIELVNKYGPPFTWTYWWHNHLNPGINKEAWTQEEELALIRVH